MELLAYVFPPDRTETDEACQEHDDFVARKFGEADYLIQGLTPFHDAEQLPNRIIIGNYRASKLLRLLPKCQMNGRG